MTMISSACGRYTVHYNTDFTGYAQIVEYAGSAPRLEIRRTEIPFELLTILMDKVSFKTQNINPETATTH